MVENNRLVMSPERYQKFKQVLAQRQLDLTVVMENIHKPHNFSAMLRSCDAVGIHRAHAVTETGDITKHHHTSSGASKWIEIETHSQIETCLQTLKQQGFQCLAAGVSGDCKDFRAVDYTQPTAIIMGSELFGLSETAKSLADQLIQIPMIGQTVSLNVSVATALILYEAQRQRASQQQPSQLDKSSQEKLLFEWCYPAIAEKCRANNLPYPTLDENGYLTPQS